MNIVVNKCYGGFSLSDTACKMLNCDPYDFSDPSTRSNPELIGCVTLLGKEAGGKCSALAVVSIPDTATDWEIEEYDGYESIIYVVGGKKIIK